MRKSYQKNKSKLVAVIEPLKYRDKPDLLMPKFGVIDVDDEDVSYLVDDELSIAEVYFEVLNEIKSKRQFPIN